MKKKLTGNWSVSQIEDYLAEKHRYYPITYITPEDLQSNEEYNASKITDEQMRALASRMADAYTDCCYWDAMRNVAEYMNLPKLEGGDEE